MVIGDASRLDGMAPNHLRVQSSRILLDRLEVRADIGFHDYEVGRQQRLLVTVEIWLDDLAPPPEDEPAGAWDYDFLRERVERLATCRRYNLQETLAHAIFDAIAEMHGVRAVRVATAKPDIYPDAESVGVEITSFKGSHPDI